MKILVHYPSMLSKPEGVWWDSPAGFRSYYEPGSQLGSLGRSTMTGLLPDVSFANVADALPEENAYGAVWTAMDVPDGTPPERALKLAQLAAQR